MEKKNWDMYERRRDTLKKKASELSSLCNVQVCLLCFGPGGDFVSWPENPSEANAVIQKYTEASEENKNRKRKRNESLNLSDFLLDKQLRDPLYLWDEHLDLLPKESLLALSRCLESKIQAIDREIGFLKAQGTRFCDEEDVEFTALLQNLLEPSPSPDLDGDGGRVLLDDSPWLGF